MDESHEPCGGFANFETWCVNRWIETDQEMSRRCRELAILATDVAYASTDGDGLWNAANPIPHLLADALHELLDELNPIADQSSAFADLMDSALESVHWREIAETFLER